MEKQNVALCQYELNKHHRGNKINNVTSRQKTIKTISHLNDKIINKRKRKTKYIYQFT